MDPEAIDKCKLRSFSFPNCENVACVGGLMQKKPQAHTWFTLDKQGNINLLWKNNESDHSVVGYFLAQTTCNNNNNKNGEKKLEAALSYIVVEI